MMLPVLATLATFLLMAQVSYGAAQVPKAVVFATDADRKADAKSGPASGSTLEGSTFVDTLCGWRGCTYDLNYKNTTYPIPYRIGGNIDNITADAAKSSIKIHAVNIGDTDWLVVYLPRELIDATETDEDGKSHLLNYTVLVNGRSAAKVEEMNTSMVQFDPEKTRILSISSLTEGRNEIEIVGTQLAPEFGLILVSIIITVGTVAGIAMFRKWGGALL